MSDQKPTVIDLPKVPGFVLTPTVFEEATPPFIAIGIPSMDYVDADFCICLASQVGSFRGITAMINSKGCYIDLGRMECVKFAQAKTAQLKDGRTIKPTHLMFFDSDMTFPNYTIQRLLEHDRDIVGCMYSRRVADASGAFSNIGLTVDTTITQVDTRQNAPLLEMKLLPTGILLIKMSVFDKLPAADDDGPIFGYRYIKDLNAYEREDVRFCRIAREHGIQIWCDPWLSTQIGHIGQAVYRVDTESKKFAEKYGTGPAKEAGVAPDAPAVAAAE